MAKPENPDSEHKPSEIPSMEDLEDSDDFVLDAECIKSEELQLDRLENDRVNPPFTNNDTLKGDYFVDRRFFQKNRFGFIGDDEILRIVASQREWSSDISEVVEDAPEAVQKVRINTPSGIVHIARYEDCQGQKAHLLQQQAQRSCCAAASSMILLDACARHSIRVLRNKKVFDEIFSSNLSNSNFQLYLLNSALRDSGYKAEALRFSNIRRESKSDFFHALKSSVDQFGSHEVSVGGEIGGHEIVVSNISPLGEGFVLTVRDPYHGWEIEILDTSFMKRQKCMIVECIRIVPDAENENITVPKNKSSFPRSWIGKIKRFFDPGSFSRGSFFE